MINDSQFSRRMGVRFGPPVVVHACPKHRHDLETGYCDYYVIDAYPIEDVDPDDEIGCDSCRGEDGE